MTAGWIEGGGAEHSHLEVDVHFLSIRDRQILNLFHRSGVSVVFLLNAKRGKTIYIYTTMSIWSKRRDLYTQIGKRQPSEAFVTIVMITRYPGLHRHGRTTACT